MAVAHQASYRMPWTGLVEILNYLIIKVFQQEQRSVQVIYPESCIVDHASFDPMFSCSICARKGCLRKRQTKRVAETSAPQPSLPGHLHDPIRFQPFAGHKNPRIWR